MVGGHDPKICPCGEEEAMSRSAADEKAGWQDTLRTERG